MKFKTIKVDDIHTAVEELKASPEFQALGFPYAPMAVNNWEAGAPKDKYEEWTLMLENYSKEEFSSSLTLQLKAHMKALVPWLTAITGDTIILVDPDIADLPMLLVASGKNKNIIGCRGDSKGGKMIPFEDGSIKGLQDVAELNKVIKEITESVPELSEYASMFE